jgi:glycosyltransferase involved in cell wall biosynthesis
MKYNKKKILIFIPAYNVEKEISSVFKRIPKGIFKKDNIYILVINDCSTDKTKNKLEKIKKSFKFNILDNKINIGYGGVQKKAYRYAIKKNFDYVITLHGDGQYTPKKLPKFIYELKNSDYEAVFGTRMWSSYSAIKGGMPMYKYLGNVFLTAVQNLILKTRFSEFHSGYRSYKINTLKKINLQKLSNDFHFDTEIIIEFVFKKFKILEIPIPTIYKDQISHLKSIPYGLNVLFSTLTHKKS